MVIYDWAVPLGCRGCPYYRPHVQSVEEEERPILQVRPLEIFIYTWGLIKYPTITNVSLNKVLDTLILYAFENGILTTLAALLSLITVESLDAGRLDSEPDTFSATSGSR